jgi:hypothetical protein
MPNSYQSSVESFHYSVHIGQQQQASQQQVYLEKPSNYKKESSTLT